MSPLGSRNLLNMSATKINFILPSFVKCSPVILGCVYYVSMRTLQVNATRTMPVYAEGEPAGFFWERVSDHVRHNL